MTYYYTALQSRSHAFILERRLKTEGVQCELSYMPRQILRDLCNMGVKFVERDLARAAEIIKRSGLPGARLYKETLNPRGSQYTEVVF